jgi:hypothetical protein
VVLSPLVNNSRMPSQNDPWVGKLLSEAQAIETDGSLILFIQNAWGPNSWKD